MLPYSASAWRRCSCSQYSSVWRAIAGSPGPTAELSIDAKTRQENKEAHYRK